MGFESTRIIGTGIGEQVLRNVAPCLRQSGLDSEVTQDTSISFYPYNSLPLGHVGGSSDHAVP